MVHSLFTYTVDFSAYSSPNMRYFVWLYMAYVILRGPNGSPDVTSHAIKLIASLDSLFEKDYYAIYAITQLRNLRNYAFTQLRNYAFTQFTQLRIYAFTHLRIYAIYAFTRLHNYAITHFSNYAFTQYSFTHFT